MIERQNFQGNLWYSDHIEFPVNTLNVFIVGREWRDSFGNTFHTAEVWIDGHWIGKSEITYGNGEHAVADTALRAMFDIPSGEDARKWVLREHMLFVTVSLTRVSVKSHL